MKWCTAAAAGLLSALLCGVATAAPHSADLRPGDHSHGVAAAQVATRAKISHPRIGLPADAPAALYRREPRLPTAKGWPASNTAFPRTSGTGRLADGALFWTDFLYDDHGTTTGSPGDPSVTGGTPSFGTYTYPDGPAHANGADIFRAAVALRHHTSYWRVDWNTLADPKVPIAEWAIRTGNGPATTQWGAGSGVTSGDGINVAMTVSSRTARVFYPATGKTLAKLPVKVDREARSFVVAVPRHVMNATGKWRVQLASGLADPTGLRFAPAANAAPGQPAVYNVGFRSRTQEPIADAFWDDMAQTQALATGDLSAFSHVVDWSQLTRRTRTAQARPTGWSDRWYTSRVDLGPGLVTGADSVADDEPNFLGRVQPYAIYVPKSYRPAHPAPLTFLLHSSNQNHNQYAATTPNFTRQACEDRHSICVTPLGRGPDGEYWKTAELDFWQVWHEVAAAYRISPDRTVLSGYSMGGEGSNWLAMSHPDLYARSVTLAGGIGDLPFVGNLRWVPTYLAGGAEDELVPVVAQRDQANAMDRRDYRYRWVVVSAIDHVSYELKDSFADAAHYMGTTSRTRHPGRIDFTWRPRTYHPTEAETNSNEFMYWSQSKRLGVGTTGDYWLRHLHARSTKRDASIHATSGERPDRKVIPHRSTKADPTFQPEPATITSLTWTRGRRPAKHATLTLRLHNVKSLTVLLRDAGFTHGRHARLVVTTDGSSTIHLGSRTLHMHKGHHVVRFTA